ncbi:hypothetical protein K461DRAFT_269527 [Myriangium duriaei CBS 260.36]|uniref:Uncharacterized protein n=1 Tax=Myriangium duriaei CBS 260.36 TaxID=1168546 RepID=A0A9P4IYY9_9PEZI|nr:hypothetical protein K461DRAFT_269527 [Myriangium duriaei CBS 260.36]
MSAIVEPVSPVRTTRPVLQVDAAPINDEPVELDGTPTSATTLPSGGPGQAHDGRQKTQNERQKLAQLIAERKSDPAVMVDLPQTPQAEELAVSGAATTIPS